MTINFSPKHAFCTLNALIYISFHELKGHHLGYRTQLFTPVGGLNMNLKRLFYCEQLYIDGFPMLSKEAAFLVRNCYVFLWACSQF